ncbi:LysM peptidoglycan-binding domain-containing protein [Aerococcus sanguinicola]|uniref:LysM domain-containing protein n=1 Tax=Aerococcus sanguinicola TaxID=119206 RepID=A0A120I911_9LACT|nr:MULTISPECIES: LysM domain-containing protein [Aerococcus]AMB93446.1 hypothetical protein AWM72_01145 [Aerococcus sanguinicola]KAB0647802.1 LysM peptidoglycan-binding domain-containing protein [Aerococcus sanguinicola]MDK6232951.1 LysM domain-containing protein [Aerococcus sp. UMB10185]MDK6855245.1 LysM domain-containing protein [Aerococcus sp. UMB7533]MDK7051024.1 LysM domain-containing protein [Aerococcus sanguinicola]
MSLRDKFNQFRKRPSDDLDQEDFDYDAYDEVDDYDYEDLGDDPETSEFTDEADQNFGEYENLKKRQYSRSARNPKGHDEKISPFAKVLTFILLVMVIVPLIITVYTANQKKTVEPQSTDQVMVSKTQNVSASKAEEESRKKASESKAKEEADKKSASIASSEQAESANQASQSAAASASIAAQQQQAAQASERASLAQSSANAQQNQQGQNTAGTSGTYTVQAGDNLYRIAVNHGMTLDQLLQANGLSANSNIAPGTVLRVQ